MINQKPAIQDSKNIRVLDTRIAQIEQLYDTRPTAVNRLLGFALKSFAILHKEVKDVFTPNELKAILDNENGTMIDERYWGNKQMFLYSLYDGFELDGIGNKWGVSYDEISEKINALPDAAFLYFHESVYRFWNESVAYGSHSPDLEKFVNDFC